MTTENNSFVNTFYKIIMPKIYGIGAAIVIAGAMFKLLNWPGGAFMLGLGLTTEAIIFFLSSFEPSAKEIDWTKVYPELDDDYVGSMHSSRMQAQSIDSVSEKLDEMFEKAKIDSALLERLGSGMQHLADSVVSMADIGHTLQITEKYTMNLQKATDNLEHVYTAHSNLASAMDMLHGLSENIQNFQTSIQGLTQTLNTANSSYTIELDEMQEKLKGTKLMYANIAGSIDEMQKASNETEEFRVELSKLNEKLSSLNNVYGNMLMALKS